MSHRHRTHQMDLHNPLDFLILWILIFLSLSLSFHLLLLLLLPLTNILFWAEIKSSFLLFCFVLFIYFLANQALCLQRLGLCLPLLVNTLWRILPIQAIVASCSVCPLSSQGETFHFTFVLLGSHLLEDPQQRVCVGSLCLPLGGVVICQRGFSAPSANCLKKECYLLKRGSLF